eukprot:TRINITY_DN938_c0_g1_i1.p1 TRINITY_DN938_c0_g1~~TRINITY_DN938_c0_g1_i1.p1  ORF type:complete len:378 (+),score=66.46 TRINITY_DN938_c0_g1_i1:830-1963(+)
MDSFTFDGMKTGLFETDDGQRIPESSDDFFEDDFSEKEEEEEDSDEESKPCRCGKKEEFKTDTYSFCTNCGGIVSEFNNYYENIKNEISHSASKVEVNSTTSLDFCVVSTFALNEKGDYGEICEVLSLFDFILFHGDSVRNRISLKENSIVSKFILAMIDKGFHFCSKDKVVKHREEFRGITTYFCVFFNPRVLSINNTHHIRADSFERAFDRVPAVEICIGPLVIEFTHIKTQRNFAVLNIFSTPTNEKEFNFFVKSNEIDAMGECIRDQLLPKGYKKEQIIICGDLNVANMTELELVLKKIQYYSGVSFCPINFEMVVMNNNEKVKKPVDQLLISTNLLSEEVKKQCSSHEDNLFTPNTIYVHFRVHLPELGDSS